MKLKEAEKLNELGIIDGLDAVYLPNEDSWCMEIILSDSVQGSRVHVLRSAIGNIKLFRSLDTLFKDADRVRGNSITRIALDQACESLPGQSELSYDS